MLGARVASAVIIFEESHGLLTASCHVCQTDMEVSSDSIRVKIWVSVEASAILILSVVLMFLDFKHEVPMKLDANFT